MGCLMLETKSIFTIFWELQQVTGNFLLGRNIITKYQAGPIHTFMWIQEQVIIMILYLFCISSAFRWSDKAFRNLEWMGCKRECLYCNFISNYFLSPFVWLYKNKLTWYRIFMFIIAPECSNWPIQVFWTFDIQYIILY